MYNFKRSFGSSVSGGFTVPEVLVASFVLALLTSVALAVIVPAMKVTREAEQSTTAQRQVVLALDRLVAEMTEMDRATVTVDSGCLSYLSHKPYTGSDPALPATSVEMLGFRSLHDVWQKFVILRHRNGKLWRREHPYSQGSELSRILPAELLSEADQGGVGEKSFANDVELFEAEEVGSSRVSLRLRSVNRDGERPQACEITLQIRMRGGI